MRGRQVAGAVQNLQDMWAVLFVIVVILLAVFFKSDADLPLMFLPYEAKDSFAGKVIWITGASSGIGAALAEDMVKAGAKVVISARRKEMLDAVADSCAKFGDRPLVLPLDVTDLSAHPIAYQTVIDKFGKVDSLVLNAGVSQRNTALDTALSVTQELMHLNFISYVSLTKIVLPDMLARKDGQIVVTSSLSGVFGTPGGTSYSATKFALHGYFNGLRGEVSKDNVSVLIVCPGPVESEIATKTHRNPALPVTPDGKKMPTARCTHLMAKAMYYRWMMEVWISEHPVLLLGYLTQYAPTLGNLLIAKLIGPARVRVLQTGGDVYDATAIFK
jgi:dehydrogenase/reductase SDR family protein 7